MKTLDRSTVRLGMTANAALSFATGLLLTAAPATVSTWLGVDIPGWLRLLGLALLGHGLILIFAIRLLAAGSAGSKNNGVNLAKLNLAVIAPYPLLMLGLVVFGLVDRDVGKLLVLADGLAVGLIAVVHAKGLGYLLRDRSAATA